MSSIPAVPPDRLPVPTGGWVPTTHAEEPDGWVVDAYGADPQSGFCEGYLTGGASPGAGGSYDRSRDLSRARIFDDHAEATAWLGTWYATFGAQTERHGHRRLLPVVRRSPVVVRLEDVPRGHVFYPIETRGGAAPFHGLVIGRGAWDLGLRDDVNPAGHVFFVNLTWGNLGGTKGGREVVDLGPLTDHLREAP